MQQRIYIGTIAVALVFLIQRNALAQTLPDAARPPPLHALTAPVLPAVPTTLAPQVQRVREQLGALDECWTGSERIRNRPPRSCPVLIRRLTRAGEPAVYAMGQALVDQRRPNLCGASGQDDLQAGELEWNMLAIVQAIASPVIVPYLLAYLVGDSQDPGNCSNCDENSAPPGDFALATCTPTVTGGNVLDLLLVITGQNFSHAVRSDNSDTGRLAQRGGYHAVVADALAWFAAHGNETRTQWLAAADTQAQSALAGHDDMARLLAIDWLAISPAHLAEATTALQGMMSRTDLAPELRNLASRWAFSHHVQVSAH